MHYLKPEAEGVLIASLFEPDWSLQRALAEIQLSESLDVIVSTPWCPENNHGMGLCCQEAQALLMASQTEYDWLFVIDEDVYVDPESLRSIVANMTSPSEPVAVGVHGCGNLDQGFLGFCGGGGYLISKQALQNLVAVPHYYEDYMSYCQHNSTYCDVVTAWMLQNRANVKILPNETTLHSWGISGDLLDSEVLKNAPSFASEFQEQLSDWTLVNGSENIRLLPSRTMLDHIQREIGNETSVIYQTLVLIRLGKVTSLHYYGDLATREYTQLEDKMAFLQLLFQVANPHSRLERKEYVGAHNVSSDDHDTT